MEPLLFPVLVFAIIIEIGYSYENNYMVKTFSYFHTYLLFSVFAIVVVFGFILFQVNYYSYIKVQMST